VEAIKSNQKLATTACLPPDAAAAAAAIDALALRSQSIKYRRRLPEPMIACPTSGNATCLHPHEMRDAALWQAVSAHAVLQLVVAAMEAGLIL